MQPTLLGHSTIKTFYSSNVQGVRAYATRNTSWCTVHGKSTKRRCAPMAYTGGRVRRGAHLRPSLAYLSAILVERLRFRSSASVLTAQSGVLPNRRCSDMPTRRWPEVFTGSESYLHASSRLVQCKSARARCGPCGELVHTPCVAHSKMVHMVHIIY